MLEGHVTDDGALMCEFVPATQALDKEPERNLRILFQYDQQGGAVSIRERFQRWPTESYKKWSRSPLSVDPGNWHHMKYEVTNTGLNISIDGRTYDSNGAAVPYKMFYVSLLSWQPTNRWHVRNFSIH